MIELLDNQLSITSSAVVVAFSEARLQIES